MLELLKSKAIDWTTYLYLVIRARLIQIGWVTEPLVSTQDYNEHRCESAYAFRTMALHTECSKLIKSRVDIDSEIWVALCEAWEHIWNGGYNLRNSPDPAHRSFLDRYILHDEPATRLILDSRRAKDVRYLPAALREWATEADLNINKSRSVDIVKSLVEKWDLHT